MLWSALAVSAQPRFNVKQLDATTGLQHDELNVFVSEDHRGFIWIGSVEGPYRYDGQQLRHFRFADGGRLPQVISHFYSMPNDEVWFSTSNGLARYSYRTDNLLNFDIDLASPAPLGLQLFGVDRASGLFLLANGAEILTVAKSNPKEVLHATPSKSVRHLALPETGGARDFLGFPWLLQTGLERIAIGKDHSIDVKSSTDPLVQTLTLTGGVIDQAGRSWLCSTSGLHLYDYASDTLLKTCTLPGNASSKVLDATVYKQYLLVATADAGMWWFDPAVGAFLKPFSANASVAATALEATRQSASLALYANKVGVVFSSSTSNGIKVFTPQPVHPQKVLDKLQMYRGGQKLVQDREGRVYVARHDGSLAIFSARGDTLAFLASNLAFASTHCSVACTRDGTVYFSNANEIYKVGDSPEFGLQLIVKSASPISTLLAMGNELVALTDQGIEHLQNEQLNLVYRDAAASTRSLLYPLDFNRALLDQFDGWRRVLSFDESRLQIVDSIYIDGEPQSVSYLSTIDTILVGTLGGLYRYTKELNRAWGKAEAVINAELVHGVEVNKGKPTWLLTSSGLMYQSDEGFRTVSQEHGLLDEHGISGALLVDGDSVLWAGFRDGLIRCRIDDLLNVREARGSVYIRKVLIDGIEQIVDSLVLTNGISINGRYQQLQLQLGTLGNYDQDRPAFEYRIIGHDSAWQALGDIDRIYLEPLTPGHYSIEARGINAAGAPLATIRLPLVSTQPYWETWWFKLVVVLGIGAFGAAVSYVMYRQRLAAARIKFEQDLLLAQERERIARELHDDLGTDLSTILYLSDTEGEPLNPEDQEEVVALSQSALARMREIVHELDGEPVSIDEVWRIVVDRSNAACRRYGVGLKANLQLELPIRLRRKRIDHLIWRNLELIVKEAVGNALRHGDPSTVSLSLKQAADSKAVLLTIADDGAGFDRQQVARGSGLINMQERAARFKGTLTIESSPGAGTRTTILLPISAKEAAQ